MLKGKISYLCEVDEKNIEWLRNQRNDPDMRKYFREWKDISVSSQIKWYNSRGNNSNMNHVYFEIHSNASTDSSLIGCAGLHYINWRTRSAEFSIFLSKNSRGKGYGNDALQTMFEYGFKEMNLHKIWGEVYEFNDALGLYVNKLGMSVDGKLRDNCFYNGNYHDSTMVSILEDEWGP